MWMEAIEWDDENLLHATRHGVSEGEIEQALSNAERVYPSRPPRSDRGAVTARTNGGRRVKVVFEIKGRGFIRPFAAWEV